MMKCRIFSDNIANLILLTPESIVWKPLLTFGKASRSALYRSFAYCVYSLYLCSDLVSSTNIMKMRSLVPPLLLLISCLSETTNAFAPSKIGDSTRLRTRLNVWFPEEGMEVARKTFGWWIMGAAGSGGAARSAFPQIYNEYMELQQ